MILKSTILKYKKNKLVKKEFNLLGDYLFCYHKDFENPLTLKKIQFCKGLKYVLGGFIKSQSQINEFIKKCRSLENKEGFLSPNFYQLQLNNLPYLQITLLNLSNILFYLLDRFHLSWTKKLLFHK